MLPAPHYISKGVAVLNEYFKTVLRIKAGSFYITQHASRVLDTVFYKILFDRKACTMITHYWEGNRLRADHSCLLKSRYFTEVNLKEYCTAERVW